jgi:hypothetical protein
VCVCGVCVCVVCVCVCVCVARKRHTVENVGQVDRCELVTADRWMSIVDLSAPTH